MISPETEEAIAEVRIYKKALFKYITPNDVGITGGHQSGFHLPIRAWQLYTPHKPQKHVNLDTFVKIKWQDSTTTHSRITWYGTGTRSEYRLTRFGRKFPFLQPDNVGNLLILIPKSLEEFSAFVLCREDDIEEFQAALGIEAFESWGTYQPNLKPEVNEDDCITLQFNSFTKALDSFPTTKTISDEVFRILSECVIDFFNFTPDEKLMRCVTDEYTLFRIIEQKLTESDVSRKFKNIDDLIETAARLLNRRKARAGKSLEHHVERILTESGIRFDSKPKIDGRVEPDILIPGKEAYNNPTFPEEKLAVIGLKTTCKDRWRQVLNEGKRVQNKHILTLQRGISHNQLCEMAASKVVLVVPKPIQNLYPTNTGISILSFADFINTMRENTSE